MRQILAVDELMNVEVLTGIALRRLSEKRIRPLASHR